MVHITIYKIHELFKIKQRNQETVDTKHICMHRGEKKC